jgi:hypothetical protein
MHLATVMGNKKNLALVEVLVEQNYFPLKQCKVTAKNFGGGGDKS